MLITNYDKDGEINRVRRKVGRDNDDILIGDNDSGPLIPDGNTDEGSDLLETTGLL